MRERIFVFDDRPEIVRIVTDLLTDEGYAVESDTHPLKGLERVRRELPDLILLDIRMAEMDGLTLCKTLKADPRTATIPIIMLSAKTEDSDVIAGLEIGADDYIGKPIRRGVLVARVKAVLRRSKPEAEPAVVKVGPLTINRDKYSAELDGRPLGLRPKEFEFLAFLAANEGRVVTRARISEAVWGHDHVRGSKTIEFHIYQLKKKLGRCGSWITPVTGIGYRFEVDVEED